MNISEAFWLVVLTVLMWGASFHALSHPNPTVMQNIQDAMVWCSVNEGVRESYGMELEDCVLNLTRDLEAYYGRGMDGQSSSDAVGGERDPDLRGAGPDGDDLAR